MHPWGGKKSVEREGGSLLSQERSPQGLASLIPVMPGERKSLGRRQGRGGEEADESKKQDAYTAFPNTG